MHTAVALTSLINGHDTIGVVNEVSVREGNYHMDLLSLYGISGISVDW